MSFTILGLTVGHDASATVLIDGKIAAHILRERQSGIRHHYGIDRICIERCLTDAGIEPGGIDAVAITATQLLPGLIEDEDYFGFQQSGPQAHSRLCGEDVKQISESSPPYLVGECATLPGIG